MWTTISLQLLYIGITAFLSWHFTRQNKLAEEVSGASVQRCEVKRSRKVGQETGSRGR